MYRALIHCLYFKSTVSCFQTCIRNIYRHERTKGNIIADLDTLCSTLKSNLASNVNSAFPFVVQFISPTESQSIPALIVQSLVKYKLERILKVVVTTQLLLYHSMYLKVLIKSIKNLNHTNLLILNFHDYRFFRDGTQYLVQ